ncbi:hypothetical protein [Vibrio injensis]|uniref:hypothetical protein n=1 Tax=Vibrio injensis TaxID=1307414 RepID=UPI0009354945|nr:hypothetical protein [Vibrio injensis]
MMSLVYKYKGLKGIRAIAEAYNISPQTLAYRIRKRGMGIEEAINAPLHERSKFQQASNVKNTEYSEPNLSYIAIRQPHAMPKLWRIALGIGASL